MASIHVYVDLKDRQWANPSNMEGLHHAHLDIAGMELTQPVIKAVVEALSCQVLLALSQLAPPNGDGSMYEVYDNADGGMRKVDTLPPSFA